MAKHNVNHSKTERLLAKATGLSPFHNPPIVIPRDKLEVAHLKVKKAQAKNTLLIYIVAIQFAVICFGLFKCL